MEQEYRYMVCTSCMTYNHAPYIVDAMNGFTMQETTFPVYYLITDDASTDGEPEVIKQYLADHFQSPYRIEETDDYNLICANHNTNPNCIFIVFLLKYNHYSIKKSKLPYLSEWRDNAKYIAICEGDDYWIHPKKLQIQVDYLESHADCGLVYSNVYTLNKNILKKSFCSGKSRLEYLLIESEVPTLTTCYRSSLYKSYLHDICPQNHNWKMGDAPLWIYISSQTRIKFFKEMFGVYRVLSESASHSANIENTINFLKSRTEMRKYMINLFIKSEENKKQLIKVLLEDNFMNRLKLYVKMKRYRDALNYYYANKSEASFSKRIEGFALLIVSPIISHFI